MSSHPPVTPAANLSRKWLIVTAVGMGIFLVTIDGSIVNIALPTLVQQLHTDFATVQWVPLAYLLTLSTLLLSMGRLGDMIGKKTVYVAGFILFTLSSLLCGLAANITWLIGFRILQAIGAAMTQSLGMAIITEAFPPAERGKALGIAGTLVSVGIVVGPTVGGLLIEAWTWRWIFFVNLPIGLLGTLLTWRFVPQTATTPGQRFDFPGAGTFLVGLLPLLLGLTLGQQWGFGDRRVWLMLLGGVLGLALFAVVEWRATQPMVDLRLFQHGLFTINLVTGFMTFIGVAGVFILLPFYLENMLGYGPRQVGLLIAAVPLLLGITAPISGILSDRYGTRLIASLGLAVLVGGYLAMSHLNTATPLLVYLLSVMPFGVGVGMFQSPNNSAVMGSVSRQQLGVASGLLASTRNLGQTTGIAVLGAVWAGRVMAYAGKVSGGVTAAPVTAQVAGLQDTFRLMAGLILAACVLSLYGLWRERRQIGATP